MKLETIKSTLTGLLKDQAYFAILFGSVVTPYFRDDSDIDLAVFLKEPPETIDNKIAFYEQFEGILPRKVDIVILNSSDIIITMQALQTGELLFNIDPERYYSFVVQKLAEYPDFKRSRKVIEDQLMKVE